MSLYAKRKSYHAVRYNPGPFGITAKIILANVAVFLLARFFRQFDWSFLFGLVPSYTFVHFRIWQLFSYMFIHTDGIHLFLNMLMLWFFGKALEQVWNPQRFLLYYLFCGFSAAGASCIVAYRSMVPIVGASGALFGIFVAYALSFPDSKIFLFFVLPLRALYAVVVVTAITLFAALRSEGSNVAYVVHLVGAVAGFLYMRSQGAEYNNLANVAFHWGRQTARKKNRSHSKKKVDVLLDKVARYGSSSLTKKERLFLNRMSEKY